MYNTEMFTQVVEYQKTLFDNSFSMMATLQDQGHQLMDKAFETTPLLPEDSKKMCSSWIDFVKQNRESCKGYVDSSFDKTKGLFEASEPASSVEKPSAATDKKSG